MQTDKDCQSAFKKCEDRFRATQHTEGESFIDERSD